MTIHMSGRTLILLFVTPVAVWLVARILDPVRTARFESRYWWRFPPGTALPEFIDSDMLATSLSGRLKARLQSAVLLFVLIAVLAANGMIFR
jgi:hypothetical protein